MKTQNTQNTFPMAAAAFAALTGISVAAAPATLSHRWSFNNSLADSVTTGASNAVILDDDNNPATGGAGDLTTTPGQVTLGGGAKGQSSYVKLGTNLLHGKTTPVTLEFWATQIGLQNWARIFDFGTDTNQYLMMSWSRGTTSTQDTLTWKSGTESAVNDHNAPYTFGTEYHVVVVIEPGAGSGGQTLVTEYAAPSNSTTMGAPKVVMSTPFTLATLADPNDWLGRSQWPDETAHASYNEFRIWNGAMAPAEVDARLVAGPDSATVVDTDGDGMPDWWETLHHLDPNNAADASLDKDGDGATNLQEYLAGSDPEDSHSNALDLDGDGLTDSWEIAHFGGLGETGLGDPDGDGATNIDEQAAGTDPLDPNSFPDTDHDGLNDIWEKKYFGTIGATNATPTADPDGDGFTNLQEYIAGTNPTLASSSPVSPALLHRWSFNGNLNDSVTTNPSNATIVDPDSAPTVGGTGDLTTYPGEVFLGGGNRDTSAYVSLGTNLLKGNITPVTIELWATSYSLQSWSRVFDFGGSTSEYVMWSWNVNGVVSQNRASWNHGNELALNNGLVPFNYGTKYHMVVTIEPPSGARTKTRMSIYAADATDPNITTMGDPLGVLYTDYKLSTLSDVNDWLGRSQFGDATANASYDEVRIWSGLMPTVIRDLFQVQGPNNLTILDADHDGMPDAWESANGLNPANAADASQDADGDHFSNLKELAASTNPFDASFTPDDIDGDTLPDAFEYKYFGNLDQGPSDDPDHDFATNIDEYTAGTNPNDKTSFLDSDHDGISDAWEFNYFSVIPSDPTGLNTANATSDYDHDGVTDLAEFVAGSDPTDPLSPGDVNGDADHDGLDDRWESHYFKNTVADLSTLGDLSLQGANGDPDGDGFTNLQEYIAGSDPTNAASTPTDIDGDGIADQTQSIDFKTAGTSGVTDATGKVTGLVRLPGSGTDPTYSPNDPNLTLTTTDIGTLGVKSGHADFNLQVGIPQLEALGVPLSSLGLTPTSNFKIRAKFVNLPAVTGNDQFGVFVGSSTTNLTRAGHIAVSDAYGTNTNNSGNDTDSLRSAGAQMGAGRSMTVEISRVFNRLEGEWLMTVNDIVVTPGVQPTFLDANTDLIAGIYALDLSGAHYTATLDSVTVTRYGSNVVSPDSDNDGMDDAWEIAKFGDLSQTGTGDFDNDGVNNLTEFAFDGDPKSASSRGIVTTALTDTDANGKKELTMTVAVRTGATFAAGANGSMTASVGGITYAIQGTTDLATFTGVVSEVGTPVAGDAGYQLHTFRLVASDGLPGKGFLRASVTK